MLISGFNREGPAQRFRHGCPDRSVLRDISLAIGDQLDYRQAAAADGTAELAPESTPVTRPGVRCPEQPGGRGNVESGWRPKQRFECRRVELLGLRKKRKDTAAVVVEYDDGDIQTEL